MESADPRWNKLHSDHLSWLSLIHIYADAVERVPEQVLSNLRSNEKDPGNIAFKLESARSCGDHPYGSDGDGTIDSVTALTRDDIVAAYKGALAKDRITIGAAGDITPAELGALLDLSLIHI